MHITGNRGSHTWGGTLSSWNSTRQQVKKITPTISPLLARRRFFDRNLKWEKASLTGSCRSGRETQKKVRLAQKIQARYTIKDSNAGSGHHPFRSRPRALSTETKYVCNNRMCCRLKPDGSGEGIKPQERMQGGSH